MKIKSKAGRSTKGRLVIRTKTSILRKLRSIKINYNYRYQPLGLVTTFQLIPFRNLVVSLVLYANGALTYLTKGLEHRAFKYLIFARNSRERKFRTFVIGRTYSRVCPGGLAPLKLKPSMQ